MGKWVEGDSEVAFNNFILHPFEHAMVTCVVMGLTCLICLSPLPEPFLHNLFFVFLLTGLKS